MGYSLHQAPRLWELKEYWKWLLFRTRDPSQLETRIHFLCSNCRWTSTTECQVLYISEMKRQIFKIYMMYSCLNVDYLSLLAFIHITYDQEREMVFMAVELKNNIIFKLLSKIHKTKNSIHLVS